jgi:hypothetical protein
MNTPTFRLFWLRESGCDAGVVRQAHQIEPSIQDRVLALTAGEGDEFNLRLPYLDRHQWRRRWQILSEFTYERDGRTIRAVLEIGDAVRDTAATLVLTDPAWQNAPMERTPSYHDVWRRVSVAIQRALKEGVAAEYFKDPSKIENRDAVYAMAVYQASRTFGEKVRRQFTWDLRNYPECGEVVSASTALIGGRLESLLELLQVRFIEAGNCKIARHLVPGWHPDVVRAVRRKPRRFLELLMREAEIVNAVIELGADRSHLAVQGCARKMNSTLRKIHGMDARGVGLTVLEAATRALARPLSQVGSGGGENLGDSGISEDRDAFSAGRPDFGVRGEENRDDRDAYSSGQVSDAGIVADVQARRLKPTRQLE